MCDSHQPLNGADSETLCRFCGQPIEEWPDAFSGGWTHGSIDQELAADHKALPVLEAK